LGVLPQYRKQYIAIGTSWQSKNQGCYDAVEESSEPAAMRILEQSLEGRIERIKEQIAALGPELLPGVLTQQYNVCGNPRCRCKADPPQRHGPYYQLSFTRNRKSSTQFVRQEDLALVRRHVRDYKRLRKLLDRWIALGMELSRFQLRQLRELRTGSQPKKRSKSRVSQEKLNLEL
jgi:hypothetical protein